ncbi:hypothetical protein V2J09_016302 [Rumex salicifolius]
MMNGYQLGSKKLKVELNRDNKQSNIERPQLVSHVPKVPEICNILGWSSTCSVVLVEMEDRIFELEALQKALDEGTEAYDEVQADLIKAKDSLSKILSSRI